VFEKSHGYGFPTDVISSEIRMPTTPVAKLQSWKGQQYFIGYEHCDTLGKGWFNTSNRNLRSPDAVSNLYQSVRKLGGNLLLDIGPNREGKIADEIAKVLIEAKSQIEPFEASLAKRKQ
jgi:hypothetical protein